MTAVCICRSQHLASSQISAGSVHSASPGDRQSDGYSIYFDANIDKEYVVQPAAPIKNNFRENCSSIMALKNPTINLFKIILFPSILFFGTIFNCIGIHIFYFKMKTYTETRVFIMNLLVSDCCLLITIPFRLYDTIYGWEMTNTCRTIRSAYFMNIYMSISIITLISVDRYLAIKFPLSSRSLRSPRKAAVVCGTIWMLLILSYIFGELMFKIKIGVGFCFRKTMPKHLYGSLYISILGFYTPLIIIMFCSIEVIKTLKTKDSNSLHEQHCIRKSVYIVSINLIVFLLCFLPVHIAYIIQFIVEYIQLDCFLITQMNNYVSALQVIGDLNCCLDALYYYLVAKEFSGKKIKLTKAVELNQITEQTQQSNL
ncbi:G-protein coupled receptor 35-like [Bombina bombina]|uniref:G-protein coupled receptor 35-like n=1 Tax=Bombina bombina TaxID=8345 RepID=UPI00235A5F50|nr:G-protein coupled receptor 35-like [Bombina bombina]